MLVVVAGVVFFSAHYYYLYMSHIICIFLSVFLSGRVFFSVVKNRAFVCLVFVLCLSFHSNCLLFLLCLACIWLPWNSTNTLIPIESHVVLFSPSWCWQQCLLFYNMVSFSCRLLSRLISEWHANESQTTQHPRVRDIWFWECEYRYIHITHDCPSNLTCRNHRSYLLMAYSLEDDIALHGRTLMTPSRKKTTNEQQNNNKTKHLDVVQK